MNTIVSRMLTTGLFFLFIFLSGFWLSRAGKPYPVLVFTIHKLIALGTLVFLTILVYQINRLAPLQTVQIIAFAITIVFLITLIITGGLVSLDKVMPVMLLRVHEVVPYLTAVSAGITLFLLLLAPGSFPTPAR
jgi:hypothetical protein